MFRNLLNNKIGNLLVYLSDNIDDLFITKALKLLYIIDVTSIKEIGVPVTWLEYEAWKNGPVAKDIYSEIRYGRCTCSESLLSKYIGTIRTKTSIRITSLSDFDDGDFTDYEMELIDRVINKFGHMTGDELISYLHENDVAWKEAREEDKYAIKLQGGHSDAKIRLTRYLTNENCKTEIYSSAYESLMFQNKI